MTNPANLYGTGQNSDDLTRTALTERRKDENEAPKVDPLAKRYWREIERYNRATSDWYEEGENIVKVYLEEAATRSSRRFALLWANIETLKPAVYTKPPTVLCSRRYKDRDPVARAAAEIIERATNTSFELYGVNEIFRMVRDDRLLPGRGTAWVRYDAVIERTEETVRSVDATGAEIEETFTREKLKSEKACVDYVHWQDFGHSVARIWADVWLVWRCVYKTEEEVAERFGGDVAARLAYNSKAPVGDHAGAATGDGDYFCKIYELWDRTNNRVSWLVDGENTFLESGPPPLNFANFFPCPEPCYATKTSKSLIPRPDYVYYRDQAKEINDLTDKIHRLTEWLIVKGFIPGGPSSVADPLEEVLRDKGNKELFVQVESYSEWAEKGGASKLIDWLPIQNVVAALQAAIQARAQLIQDVFQISGIADVLRGQSDPGETYGAVELRAQTGTRRLRNTKDDLARFCRDVARLCAEVIAENFSPKSIAEITGFRFVPSQPAPMAGLPAMLGMPGSMPMGPNVAMFPGAQRQAGPTLDMTPDGGNAFSYGAGSPPPRPGLPAVMQGAQAPASDDNPGLTFDERVMALLRDDKLRSFRIDIETDSTVQADENGERRSRTEFVEAAGTYLERAVKIVQAAPSLAKTAGELLLFAARSFHAGRNLEETLERDFDALVKEVMAARQQPKPEDPLVQVARVQVAGEIEKNRTDSALKAQDMKTDATLELRQQNIDRDLRIREQDLQASAKARDAATRMMGRISRIGTSG